MRLGLSRWVFLGALAGAACSSGGSTGSRPRRAADAPAGKIEVGEVVRAEVFPLNPGAQPSLTSDAGAGSEPTSASLDGLITGEIEGLDDATRAQEIADGRGVRYLVKLVTGDLRNVTVVSDAPERRFKVGEKVELAYGGKMVRIGLAPPPEPEGKKKKSRK